MQAALQLKHQFPEAVAYSVEGGVMGMRNDEL
jgi:hypothetical protein